MKHLFVPYELALKLKEKGFDEPCLRRWSWYYSPYFGGKELPESPKLIDELEHFEEVNKELPRKYCFAPLYQQVIDWLALKGIAIERRWYSDDKAYKYWVKLKNGIFVFQYKDKAIEEALKLI